MGEGDTIRSDFETLEGSVYLTKSPTTIIGVTGDPHFRTWSNNLFDFHGVCDMILLKNDGFEKGLGMSIHLRTSLIRNNWSYVSAVAISIGNDIVEIKGGKGKSFWINSIPEKEINANNNKGDLHTLAATISGYPIYFERVSGKSKRYSINLGKDDQIVVGAWNSFVYVNFQNATKEHFGDSKGLMGSFPDGLKLGRDSKTIFEDMNAFGQEWQVLSSEPKAFHTYNGQQNSNECYIPSSKEMRHRLEK